MTLGRMCCIPQPGCGLRMHPEVLPFILQALLDDSTFCGLALDEDNQDDLSADRIKKWVAQIKKEI